jgi:hypothetical protein
MPIPLRTLREAARMPAPLRKSLREARAQEERTAFLCHSSKDNDLARGLVRLLQDGGWRVYVDYEDTALPLMPDRETARRIRDAIRLANFFLFLASPNSVQSRWCPWEIGFADGCKNEEKIWVAQTKESNGRVYGNEYLDLYRNLDISDEGTLGVWEPGKSEGLVVSAL